MKGSCDWEMYIWYFEAGLVAAAWKKGALNTEFLWDRYPWHQSKLELHRITKFL